MSWVTEKERLQDQVRVLDPAIRLTTKNGWFWKALAWLLFVLTFGQFKREAFLTNFATTIGHIQAYPEEWDAVTVERVMWHEGRHTRQMRVCGFGIHPMAGLPIMGVLYGLVPFPVLGAFFRAWFELDADSFAWRHALATGSMNAATIRWRAQAFAETISGPAYFWSVWRGLAVWWFVRKAEQVIAEHSSK
jgi:hypothetical protein